MYGVHWTLNLWHEIYCIFSALPCCISLYAILRLFFLLDIANGQCHTGDVQCSPELRLFLDICEFGIFTFQFDLDDITLQASIIRISHNFANSCEFCHSFQNKH